MLSSHAQNTSRTKWSWTLELGQVCEDKISFKILIVLSYDTVLSGNMVTNFPEELLTPSGGGVLGVYVADMQNNTRVARIVQLVL
jgi:hypothetical protein